MGVVMKNPGVQLVTINWSFLPEVDHNLIGFIVILHLGVFMVVYLSECPAYRQYAHAYKFTVKESWSFVGAILFQRDLGGMAARGWCGRAVAITYAFGMTVLISTYTASLTAENIYDGDKPAFNGLRDKKVCFNS